MAKETQMTAAISLFERVTKAIHEAMDLTDGLDIIAAARYAQVALTEVSAAMADAGKVEIDHD